MIILTEAQKNAFNPEFDNWKKTKDGNFYYYERRNHIFADSNSNIILPENGNYHFPYCNAHHFLALQCSLSRERKSNGEQFIESNGFRDRNTFYTCHNIDFNERRRLINERWYNNKLENIPFILSINNTHRIDESFWYIHQIGEPNDPSILIFKRCTWLNDMLIRNF